VAALACLDDAIAAGAAGEPVQSLRAELEKVLGPAYSRYREALAKPQSR
jgi:hypothetical protein